MAGILVVEDDMKFNKIMCSTLVAHNFRVRGCSNPDEAFEVMQKQSFDIIITDVMMPKTDGFSFAKEVRMFDSEVPILFITALDDFKSKERGFRIGIDDYMVKPIDINEMILRVEALLRRAKIANEKELVIGSLVLVKSEMSVTYKGKMIDVTGKEFEILYKLLSYPKKIFTRSELNEDYLGDENETGLRIVDVYITRLRSKLAMCDEIEIITVHGFGYKVVPR